MFSRILPHDIVIAYSTKGKFMKNFTQILIFLALLVSSVFLIGCFQAQSDDCNYRTVPTTNNPNNLPNGGASRTPF